MYCNSMSLQIWLLCVSMLNFGQVSYFGIHRSPLLLLTSNYWKEKGHLEETTQAWSWLKCLEKVNKSPRWWWKLVFYIISTMVQSVKKSLNKSKQGFSLLKKKLHLTSVGVKYASNTHSNCKQVPSRKKSCPDFRKLISWKMFLLCKCGKKSHHCPPSTTLQPLNGGNLQSTSRAWWWYFMHPKGLTSNVTLQLNAQKMQLLTAKNHIPKIIMSQAFRCWFQKRYFLCFAF